MALTERFNIFLSHSGQEKRDFVDLVYQLVVYRGGLLSKQRAFLDEHSLPKGAREPWELICKAAAHCDAALVVLSQSYVRKEHPMAELELLLRRSARDPNGFILLPVFLDLSVEACLDLEAWYSSTPWPADLPEVDQATLRKWAGLAQQLAEHNAGCRLDQAGGFKGAFAVHVADSVIECLVTAGKLPPSLASKEQPVDLQRVLLPRPSRHLVGRQQEIQEVMEGLCGPAGAVVMVGPPGEGKSTVALHAAWELCRQGWFPGGALCVDLSGFSSANKVKDFLASRMTGRLRAAKGFTTGWTGSSWNAVRDWLAYDAQGNVLLVLDNTEDVLRHEKAVLELIRLLEEELQQLYDDEGRRVRLVVNSRTKPDMHLDAARFISLGSLPDADAVQLLQVHSGKGELWRMEGEALELARMCQGNPLALVIMASFINQGRCTPQVALRRYTASRKLTRVTSHQQHAAWELDSHRIHLCWLLSILHPEERDAVAALSLFAGSFNSDGAAAMICGSRGTGKAASSAAGPAEAAAKPAAARSHAAAGKSCEDQVEGMLQQLQHLSIINIQPAAVACPAVSANTSTPHSHPQAAPPRYQMHLLVREVASDMGSQLHAQAMQQQLWRSCIWGLLAVLLAVFWHLALALLAVIMLAHQGWEMLRLHRNHASVLPLKWFVFWMLKHQQGPGQVLLGHHRQRAVEACQQLVAAEGHNLIEAVRLVDDVLGALDKAAMPAAARELQACVEQVMEVYVAVVDELQDRSIVTAKQGKQGVVEQLRRSLGECHIVTLRAERSLARTMYDAGQWEDARDVLQVLLGKMCDATSTGSPDAGLCRRQLIEVLVKLGQVEAAKEVVAACLKALGADHLETLACMRALGDGCHSLGRLGEAREVLQVVVKGYERVLGGVDMQTLGCQQVLAGILTTLAKERQKGASQQQVLETCYVYKLQEPGYWLGPLDEEGRHQKELVWQVLGMAELLQAQALLQHVIATYTQSQGANHLDTLGAMGEMVTVLELMGELVAAEQLLHEVAYGHAQNEGAQRRVDDEYQGQLRRISSRRQRMTEISISRWKGLAVPQRQGSTLGVLKAAWDVFRAVGL